MAFIYILGVTIIYELDVDPRRDNDASPMSSYRCMLRPTWMFMDRMIGWWHQSMCTAKAKNYLQNTTADFFCPWHHGMITNLVKLILLEQEEMLLPWWENEHLKCTATLPLYITSESAVSRTNFSALLLP